MLAEALTEGLHPPQAKLGTVGQTLAILRFLAATPRAVGVNAIARALGLAPSSCFKILKTLQDEDFAQFDPESKCYSLGSSAVILARRALDPGNIFAMIRPMLTRFAAEHDVSVGFWRRVQTDRLVLAGFIESSNPLRIHMSVGQRLPLFIGAIGRAFASELALSEQAIRKELAKLRWQAPPSETAYFEQVALCRQLGYAVDENNFAPGVTTIATVLEDGLGAAAYGLSAIRLSTQLPEAETRKIGTALVLLRQELSRAL